MSPAFDPEIQHQMQLLVALEDRLVNLLELREQMKEAGALSVNFALESDRLLSTQDASKLYFGDGSKVKKYEVAMESIDGGIWALIAAGAAAVVGIIVAVINHFRGKGSSSGVASGVSSEAFKAATAAVQPLTHLALPAPAIHEANQLMAHQPKIATEDFGHSPHVADHAGFVKPLTAFQMDHLSTGEYSHLFQDVLETMERTQPMHVLEDARRAYRQVTAGNHAGDVSASKQHFMQLLANPRRAHREVMEKVNAAKAKEERLNSGEVEFPKDINHALKLFTSAVTSRALALYVKEREELVPELERLRHEAEQVKKAIDEQAKKGEAHSEMANQSKEVMKEMHGLLAVMLRVDISFQKYWKSLNIDSKYLHHIVSTARWKLVLNLQDKRMTRLQAQADPSVQQLDKILSALEGFRKKSS
jgi:hypothetical protein